MTALELIEAVDAALAKKLMFAEAFGDGRFRLTFAAIDEEKAVLALVFGS